MTNLGEELLVEIHTVEFLLTINEKFIRTLLKTQNLKNLGSQENIDSALLGHTVPVVWFRHRVLRFDL